MSVLGGAVEDGLEGWQMRLRRRYLGNSLDVRSLRVDAKPGQQFCMILYDDIVDRRETDPCIIF